jgi:DeoR/GlpR family transcriptional regulator of sugar metabolism
MKAELRREQILKLLEKTGILSFGELADRFAHSLVTIRKDLDDLASEGLLQRTGGS